MRRLLLAVGVLSAGGGLVLAVRPELAGFGETSILTVLGVLALVQTVRVALGRKGHTPSVAETPDPETEQELPAPGEDLDGALAAVHRTPPGRATRRVEKRRARHRDAVRDRIESAAVETIVGQHGVSRERARRAIETGEWTDDPDAAAFLSDAVEVAVGRGERLRRALSRTPPFRRRAERAAVAVADLADAERGPELTAVGPSAETAESRPSTPTSTATDGGRREGSR